MAVNLHHLRSKVAAAATVKWLAVRVASIPVGRSLVKGWSYRLEGSAPGEASGSYTGLLGQLLTQALNTSAEPPASQVPKYDPIAGIVPGAGGRGAVTEAELISRGQAAREEQRPADLIAVAAAYRRPPIADFREALRYYQDAFLLNPHDLRSVEGVINMGARSSFDWPVIYSHIAGLKPKKGPWSDVAAWEALGRIFQEEVTSSTLREAEDLITTFESQLAAVHQLFLEALAARLQFLGRFRLGTRVRRQMARNRIKELRGIPLDSSLWLKHLVGAYVYVGEMKEAARAVSRPWVDRTDWLTKLQVEKLHADVELLAGNVEPLLRHTRSRRESLPLPGEDRMSELVRGKRVAVVGPADSDEEYGALIDSYDVVIRTRYQPSFVRANARRVGSRTDIAYYSGRDLQGLKDEVADAVEAGDFHLAVARPFYSEAFHDAPQWLRFARCEAGLYFRGAPLGIHRILYDLIQFEPEHIGVFYSDLYTGRKPFSAGYRDGVHAFGEDSIMNDLVMVHDVATEFLSLRALAALDQITAYGVSQEILNLSQEDYLFRVEAAFAS